MYGYFEGACGSDRFENPIISRARRVCSFSRLSHILPFIYVFLLSQGAIVQGSDREKAAEKRPDYINSGFVFVDGKYLDAPYRVEARDLAVYINGIQASQKEEVEPYKKYCFDHDPGMPKGLTKNMSLDACYSLREPGGRAFIDAKMGYLFTHFSYEEAFKKAVEFYRSLPFVKSLV